MPKEQRANSTGYSPQQINEKIKLYQQSESDSLATKLLIHFESLVQMAARKISRNRNDLYEDLFQVGQMSLLRLLRHYDLEQEGPFEAYAMKSLIGYMKNYLRDKSWYVQVPRRIKEKGTRVRKAVDELTVSLNRSPQIREIAEYLDISEEETMEILAGQEYYQPISLDAPLNNEEGSNSMGDLVPAIENDYERVENRLDIQKAMKKLEEVERNVVDLAFKKGENQRKIAEQLGVSQMTVSRIQKRAILKLKNHLA